MCGDGKHHTVVLLHELFLLKLAFGRHVRKHEHDLSFATEKVLLKSGLEVLAVDRLAFAG